MATEIPIINASYIAGADLSAESNLWKFVKRNGTGRQVVLCSAVTDKPCGVLQTLATSGNVVTVMMLGQSKISGDANLAQGNMIGTSADGQAAAYAFGTDTTKYIVGEVVTENGAAGGIVSAWINCINPPRGA